MRLLAAVALGVLAACSEDPSQVPSGAAFPANYRDTYTEVRDCRKSGDHDLAFVRILADPAAREPYLTREQPFPDGAVVLKEEYDFSDDTCAGPVTSYTVMLRASAKADQLGWDWQRVDAGRNLTEQNGPRCRNCHLACSGGAGVGYEHTCAEP